MNNKFTKGAENALKNARETAQLLGHTHIGSEHLLLGIASTAASVGARLLESVHAEKDALLSKTKEICGFGAKSNVSPDDLTASARKIITDAGKELIVSVLLKLEQNIFYMLFYVTTAPPLARCYMNVTFPQKH